jgi:Family of unknown function (DUF6064)
MTEWWTYRLSDFLMFSPAIYWRMVERLNRELWPLPLVALAVGLVLLVTVATRPGWAPRAVLAVLGLAWAWVGWTFHWQRYAPINWVAQYFAVAFWVQAALLSGAPLARPGHRVPRVPAVRHAGLGLALAGLLLYPLLGVVLGRPWAQAEVAGLVPEPTALATLGLLMALQPRHWRWLAVVPVLALLVGIATGWAFWG